MLVEFPVIVNVIVHYAFSSLKIRKYGIKATVVAVPRREEIL